MQVTFMVKLMVSLVNELESKGNLNRRVSKLIIPV